MSVKKKRTIGPCRGVTWLYYVVFLWSRDFFPPLYLDPRFRPLLLKLLYIVTSCCQKCVMICCQQHLLSTNRNLNLSENGSFGSYDGFF